MWTEEKMIQEEKFWNRSQTCIYIPDIPWQPAKMARRRCLISGRGKKGSHYLEPEIWHIPSGGRSWRRSWSLQNRDCSGWKRNMFCRRRHAILEKHPGLYCPVRSVPSIKKAEKPGRCTAWSCFPDSKKRMILPQGWKRSEIYTQTGVRSLACPVMIFWRSCWKSVRKACIFRHISGRHIFPCLGQSPVLIP